MAATDSQHFAPIDFRTRFPALDGLRALAILLVFAAHLGGGSHGGRLLQFINVLRQRGWVGVDLFFVLSGFLITGILFDTRADSHYFKRFFARRSLRIFPAFYLTAIVLLLLTPIVHYRWRWGHATFLVYLGNFFANADDWLYDVMSDTHPNSSVQIGHLWSLCVEEQFYWFWPLIVFRVGDRRRLLRISLALSAAALLLRVVMVLLLPSDIAGWWIIRTLPFRLDALLLGGALALLLRGPAADLWQRRAKWCLAISGGLTAIVLFVFAFNSPMVLTVGLTLTATTSAGLIGTVLPPRNAASRFFATRPLRVLGRYSYGFYIVHMLFALAWIELLVYLHGLLHSVALAGVVELTAAFCLTFLAAKLSYDHIESRFLRLKSRFAYDIEQPHTQPALRV